jgi:hypothetical protein
MWGLSRQVTRLHRVRGLYLRLRVQTIWRALCVGEWRIAAKALYQPFVYGAISARTYTTGDTFEIREDP